VSNHDIHIRVQLYAGGSQDRWDIEQLLARPDRAVIINAVERSLSQLPANAQRLWRALALRDDDERPT
jgi:hypothetical protein